VNGKNRHRGMVRGMEQQFSSVGKKGAVNLMYGKRMGGSTLEKKGLEILQETEKKGGEGIKGNGWKGITIIS